MNIVSPYRRKLEPKRRFGGRSFRNNIRAAANYKRAFDPNPRTLFNKTLAKLGLASKFWRTFAAIIIIVLVYYFCISSRFVVANVSVAGNVQVSTQEIQSAIDQAGHSRLFLVKKNNFFVMTEGRVNKLLTKAFPMIKVASTKRVWPDQIQIQIKERVPGFVIESNGKYFLVDEEGTVVSQVENSQNRLLVQDQLTEAFASGEILHNSKLSTFVLSMNRAWPTKVGIAISSVKFPGKESTDVQFVTIEGWSVMFDTTRPVVNQLNDLAVLLNKQIAARDRPRLEYIDLRLSKWAYYCFKATPCSQTAAQDTAGANTNVSN